MIRVSSFLLWTAMMVCSTQAISAPQRYDLEKDRSEVRFTYEFSGAETSGTMPISSAELTLDLTNIPASSAKVTLQAAQAETALGFARQPLLSDTVLNVSDFPTIQFSSTSVSGSLAKGGKIAGNITLRGVTRPLVLDAQIFRPEGSQPQDTSRLTLILTGAVNRHDFGASGFPNLVGDIVTLHIRARINARN